MFIIMPTHLKFKPDNYVHTVATFEGLARGKNIIHCDGNIKAVVADTKEMCFNMIADDVCLYSQHIIDSWRSVRFKDLELHYRYAEVADGRFWAPGPSNSIEVDKLLSQYA